MHPDGADASLPPSAVPGSQPTDAAGAAARSGPAGSGPAEAGTAGWGPSGSRSTAPEPWGSPTSAPPAPPAAAELFGDALDLAERYAALLASEGVEWGLIGPREAQRIWERHVLNSLAVAGFVPPRAAVADVGSGAGLPGIPLALARPDLKITLLEPLERRARFLGLAVDRLGLGERVHVVRARAEEHRGRYDAVTCRAVAPLPRLLGWTVPLFQPGGRLVALKGRSAAEELARASAELRRRHLSGRVEIVHVTPDAEPTSVIVIQ